MTAPTDDPIRPVEIEHLVDEIWVGGRLNHYYNLFDYHFERGTAYCRARCYADEMEKVVVYRPFASRDAIQPFDDAAFERDVHAYLQRRFPTVERG